MAQSICILGRQPALGLAELESLYGSDRVRPAGKEAALVDVDCADIQFQHLGGSIKLGQLLTTLNTTNWRDIEKYLIDTAPNHLQHLPEGKLHIGLSVYDVAVKSNQLLAAGLSLKKTLRQAGRSVRLVPNKEPALNSAQVLHNRLAGELGWEFLIVRDGGKTRLGLTKAVQDIDAYAARDQARPKRDARVGMLPPKLAQIIINLAYGQIEEKGERSMENGTDGREPHAAYPLLHTPAEGLTVLDPFCGTGVVLQEALLMGLGAYGTDLEPRMIEYSQANLDWLTAKFHLHSPTFHLEHGDATNHTWTHDFHAVACETYLGRPFSAAPAPDVLRQVMTDVNLIHRKFLQNLARQTKPGFRACLAVPAWHVGTDMFKHLSVLDNLAELGYTRLSFVHAETKDLLYYRPDQVVARELVILERV